MHVGHPECLDNQSSIFCKYGTPFAAMDMEKKLINLCNRKTGASYGIKKHIKGA